MNLDFIYPEEKIGPSYSAQALDRAQDLAWEALRKIASEMRPGMDEETGRRRALEILEAMGAEKHWHTPKIRFGRNTLKTFAEASEPEVRLGESDVFFIDIGPVFGGHEADVGETFVMGSDPEMQRLAVDARRIHQVLAGAWLGAAGAISDSGRLVEGGKSSAHSEHAGITGRELYRLAQAEAEEGGWILQLANASGHRVSEFPHKAYHRGALADFDHLPSAHRWILEVQLKHPSLPIGAFYEDLLR